MNSQPEQTQGQIPATTDAETFVEMQAATQAEAERLFGAVFDQPETEANHG